MDCYTSLTGTLAGLKPTLRIYGHLLKAFSQTRDVAAASQAFQEMHLAGIKPNLVSSLL